MSGTKSVITWIGLYDKEVALGNELDELDQQITRLQKKVQDVTVEWLRTNREMQNFIRKDGD